MWGIRVSDAGANTVVIRDMCRDIPGPVPRACQSGPWLPAWPCMHTFHIAHAAPRQSTPPLLRPAPPLMSRGVT